MSNSRRVFTAYQATGAGSARGTTGLRAHAGRLRRMSRLERLINLVAALLDTDRLLTAEELHERVPGYASERTTFRRAFERDKETLRDLGIPISVEPVDPDDPSALGYRIRRDEYYLPDPGFEADELAALHLAASAVRLEGACGIEALWKLGGAVAEHGPVAEIAALPGAAHLAVLFGAISERRRVAFTYRGLRREVDPFRLSFRNGHWYLAALDHTRDGERRFRLDRIEGDVAAIGEPGGFERPAVAGKQPPPWLLGDDEPVTARLLVDAEQAGWAIGQVGPTGVEERRADGSVVLAVRVTNRAAFRSFVLGFLDHAEVLEPQELREEFVEWLETMCPA
jgi:predicted DNA-binding transcriptional regulator YafY